MSEGNNGTASKWATYGNNYFILSTKIGTDAFEFDGVMSELPSVSFSTDWEPTPQAEIGNKLDELLNNDMLQFIAAKNGADSGGKMQAMDAMTSRMYKNYSPPKFDIKFRCYPGQKIGPHKLRNAAEWKGFLSLSTPANSECGFSFGNWMDQISSAANGAKNFFKSLGEEKKADKDKSEEDQKKEQEAADGVSLESRKSTYEISQTNIAGAETSSSNEGMAELEAAISAFQNDNPVDLDGNRSMTNNHHKIYGANLFQLRIFPFIFTKPLTVYIDSWSITPSREWNTDMNDHYYYDFTISCTMDQKLCSYSWQLMMAGSKL